MNGIYAEERQQAIAELVHTHGRASVSDLAQRFAVTSETIRRDLDVLSSRGLVGRVHGGAVPPERIRLVEAGVGAREASQAAEKQRIAQAALAWLPTTEDATILLDAGTTVGRLAELLPPNRVKTVVTNSLSAASAVSMRSVADVELLGGRVRGITQASVGSSTVDALRGLRVDVAFLGANGFSPTYGFSTPDPAEGSVKKAMVDCGRIVVMLADSTKYGSDYLVRFARLHDVQVLITDDGLPASHLKSLADQGIEVVLA